jgi:hypothetical protein
MNENHQIILRILLAATDPMTRQDIWLAMTKEQRDLFKGEINDLSKALDVLKVKKGMIRNGLSVIEANKTLLTWVLTVQGRAAITNLTSMSSAEQPAPADTTPTTTPTSTESPQPTEPDGLAALDGALAIIRQAFITATAAKPAITPAQLAAYQNTLAFGKSIALLANHTEHADNFDALQDLLQNQA